MCPASTSTATPSGYRQSVTSTLRFEPSVFMERTRPPLRSSTNKLPICFLLARLGVCLGYGAVDAQALDLRRVEPQFLEDLVVVFAELRGALRRDFRDTVHLNGTANRRGQASSGALQRNDDVVLPQLRVIDDVGGGLNAAECDPGLFEDFVPVGHRFGAEHFVEDGG